MKRVFKQGLNARQIFTEVLVEYLQEIPLTEEILLRLGFVFTTDTLFHQLVGESAAVVVDIRYNTRPTLYVRLSNSKGRTIQVDPATYPLLQRPAQLEAAHRIVTKATIFPSLFDLFNAAPLVEDRFEEFLMKLLPLIQDGNFISEQQEIAKQKAAKFHGLN